MDLDHHPSIVTPSHALCAILNDAEAQFAEMWRACLASQRPMTRTTEATYRQPIMSQLRGVHLWVRRFLILKTTIT